MMHNLIYILFFSIYLNPHPIHLTVTNIEYNQTEKKLDISTRIFADDFELILEHYNNEKINFGKKNENPNADKFAIDYFLNNIHLKINNKDIKDSKYSLTGRKLEGKGSEMVVWLYFELNFKNKIENIEITNSLLTDLYRDQKNLLIFTYNNEQSALEFNNKKTKNSLTY